MWPKTYRRHERGNRSYIRHDRFFTLLGFFVILATFIAKEVVVEHLKELSATVSSAQSSYYPRVDQIFDTSYHTLWPANANTVRQEAKNTVENCRKTQALLAAGRELAGVLPSYKDFSKRADAIDGKCNWIVIQAEMFEHATVGESMEKTETELENLGQQSNLVARECEDLRDEITDQATALHEKRESRLKIARWSAYIFFALGSILALYGQLSGKPPEKPI